MILKTVNLITLMEDDFDIQTSDSDSNENWKKAAIQPNTSQVKTKQYIWKPATRQLLVTMFIGMQGPTSEIAVADEESPL